uniref:Uncharacterized protein n=2 Tax=Araneus ventricosus TaxID=182803 RepID=A0A4Y2EVN8_ARAVE|nr:hypothetical protein AVEN_240403-1 [Araneus ventricosus]
MNIIKDIRDALLYAVENRSPPPRTPMDLWTVLKDEWCELPPRYFQTLVESMPHRVAALLLGAVHDGFPPSAYLGGPGASRCSSEGGYIMSLKKSGIRRFQWSPCSIQQFRHFLK